MKLYYLPRWWLCLLAYLFLVRAVDPIQLFTETTAPKGLSAGCLTALTAEVPCSPLVPRFRYGYFYSASTLNSSCTQECDSALVSYESSVNSACKDDVWDGYDDEGGAPLGWIPSLLRYQYSLTCLQDSGRWCNVVTGAAAAIADPGESPISFTDIVANGTDISPCDMCFVKGLRIQASVPYYDGPAIISQSIYESKTSSCSISGMPRTTSSLPATIVPLPESTPAPCAGEVYQLQPNQSCHSVSLSQKIGTAWLLSDNQLGAWCADFPTSGSLCLVNKCEVATVQANATCRGIARSANITETQLKAWNPVLNAGCYNINRMVGDQLCISPPGDAYEDPPTTTLAPTVAITPAPVPTDIANGTTQRCGKYYQVQPDEYCNLLVVRYSISLGDFLFLNPDLYENCTNLYAYESYCIQPVGDINTYSGKPGWRPTDITSVPFTSAVPATAANTTTPIAQLPTSLPIDTGSRDDCYRYFDGADYQDASVLEGTSWINQCQRVADLYGVSWDDFASWNGNLGDIRTPNCVFDPKMRYCGKQYAGDPAPEPTPPDYTLPIRDGAIETCTEFADVPEDWQCTDVLANYELTIAQFYEYNPAVGSDCGNLWPNMAYCIRAPGYTDPSATTSGPSGTATPTSTSTPGPSPTQSGNAVAKCNKYAQAEKGDLCTNFAERNNVSLQQLYTWNTLLKSDGSGCASNLWGGYWYCVGVQDDSGLKPTSSKQ
ncbi:carbohydrate-binding module family 50 protein [Annulohypoxylon stygium]|nr:carbohydrate-binding module family 50 protein [Annulohypoxylon stygium]